MRRVLPVVLALAACAHRPAGPRPQTEAEVRAVLSKLTGGEKVRVMRAGGATEVDTFVDFDPRYPAYFWIGTSFVDTRTVQVSEVARLDVLDTR